MIVGMNGPEEPFTIHLETENYLLRTIDSSDATEDWGSWLLEPTTLAALNAAPLKLDVAMIRSYIATFDRLKSHLLGIFEKESGTLIGIRSLYIDWFHREFMVNILIGQVGLRAKGAMRQTRDALYHHLFEDWGMETARSSVLATNTVVNAYMQADGWELVHTTTKTAAGGSAGIEVREYQMTRDQNRRYERRRGIFQQAKAS
jgi:hypothetical protein